MEEVEDEVEDAKDDLSKATLNLFKASIKCPTSSFVTGVLIHLLYRKQVLLSSLKPMASANPNREKPEPECVERWTKQESRMAQVEPKVDRSQQRNQDAKGDP